MAQFDPVVIPVSADTEQLERAFKKVAQSADKTAKSVSKSFNDAFKTIGKAPGGVANFAQATGKTLSKAGGFASGAFGVAMGLSDVADAFSSISAAGRSLANPTGELKRFSQAAVESSGKIITSLGQIGLAFQGIQGSVALATGAMRGFFNATVGREIEFRKTVLSIQTTLASTNRVFDKAGREITQPLEKIRSLEKPVRTAIKNIIKESENISGTTSEEIISLFQIISTYSGQAKLSIKEAEQLSLKFAAGLGTLGIPGYQATQEIGSILSGEITSDSALAKRLQITPKDIEKAKQSAGGLFKFLNDRLATVVAGQAEAAKGFEGLVSNIQEIQQNIQQAFGEPLLDPLLDGLNTLYDLLVGTKDQFKAAATAAGELVAKLTSNVFGGAFKGLTSVATSVRENLQSNNAKEVGTSLLRSLESAGSSIGRSLESVLDKLAEKMSSIIAAFGKLVTVIAKLELQKFATSITTLASSTELYLNLIFNLQAVLLNLKANILNALGPLGQFIQAFRAVDQVLGPVIKGVTGLGMLLIPLAFNFQATVKGLRDFGFAVSQLVQAARQVKNLEQFAQAAKALSEYSKISATVGGTATATFQALNMLAGAGVMLGKVFGALGPIFATVGKFVGGLILQMMLLQAVTAAVQVAVTLGVMAWQKYEDRQRVLADVVEKRASAERLLRGEIEKGTDAVARRNREEDLRNAEENINQIRQAYKELQDVLRDDKNLNFLNGFSDGLGQSVSRARRNLITNLGGGVAGDEKDQILADTIRKLNPEFEKALSQAQTGEQRDAIAAKFVRDKLGTPEQVKALGKSLQNEIRKIDSELNKELKRIEADRIESAAKTAFENLAQYVSNTAAVSLNSWNEAVGALQAKLAGLAPNSNEYKKTESALALAKAQLQEAGKSVADRFLEAKQHALNIAKTLLDGEEWARSIRRETEREVRQSVMAGIDEETAALVEQMESKKQREEDIQTRIKKNQLEVAEIAARMAKNLVEKTLIIQGLWQSISAQMQNTANQMVKAAEEAVQRMQSQDPGLATRSGFRGAMGNSGDSNGIHFHLQNNNTNQLLKDAVKEVLYMFRNQGAESIYLGRSGATLTPGMREAQLRELLDAERRAHGGIAIDMQGKSGAGLGKRPDGRPFLTANILRNWGFRRGLGYSGDAEGGTLYGHFDGRVSVAGPAHSSMERRTARASWYGNEFIGRKTASGEKYTPDMMGVAHRTLPFGTVIEFEHGGRKVVAQVVDRGPHIAGREFDLMEAPASQLGIKGKGVTDLNYRIMERGRGQVRMPEALRQMAAATGLIPVPSAADARRYAETASATLGLDREAEQLATQKSAIERETAALKEQAAALSRINILKDKEARAEFQRSQETLRQKKREEFERERVRISTLPLDQQEQARINLAVQEDVYSRIGAQLEDIRKITLPYAQKNIQTETDPARRRALEEVLRVAPQLIASLNKGLPGIEKLSRSIQEFEVQKAQNSALIEATNATKKAQRLVNIDRTSSPLEQTLEEWKSQLDFTPASKLVTQKWAEILENFKDTVNKQFGEMFRKTREERFFQELETGGLSPREIAIRRLAAEQVGGVDNLLRLEKENPANYKAVLGSSQVNFDARQRVDFEAQLKSSERQLELDRLKLKEMTAVTNEQKAQLALERELLALAPTGKTMTEEEQERFKAIQISNLNLQNQIDLLSQLQEGFRGFTTDVITGFGQAADAGTSFWDALRNSMGTFFQRLGDYLLQLAAQQAANSTTGWIKDILNIGSQVIGSFGSAGPVAGLPQAWNTGQKYGPAFANGGIAQDGFLPMRAFASGGLVTQPTLGLVGEGRYNEAIVPLPDGKSIPVQLAGGTGQAVTTNITVNVSNGQMQTEGGVGGNNLSRKLEAAVKQVIANELRPGGLIPGGRR